MLCTHKTTSSASLVLKFVLQFNNSYLNQFSSISGGNCIMKVWIYMVRFVDDTSWSTNDFFQPTLLDEQHYLAQANKDAQRWNNILQLSGGALQPLKCSYHFLFYKLSNTGIPYLCSNTNDPHIHLQFQLDSPLQH